MNEGIKKFRELLLTDTEFQQKLKAASEAYAGAKTEEAIFNDVMVPLAQEYGISATFEDYKAYTQGLDDQEIDSEELAQIAGGGKGFGAVLCASWGIGLGGTSTGDNMCLGVGFGTKEAACAGKGTD